MGMRMLLKPEVRVMGGVDSIVSELVSIFGRPSTQKKFKFFYIADGFIL
jgi:hypothetical protein